jgi:hypothetical protein
MEEDIAEEPAYGKCDQRIQGMRIDIGWDQCKEEVGRT